MAEPLSIFPRCPSSILSMGFNASPSSLHTAAGNIFEILNDASDSDKTEVPNKVTREKHTVLGEVSAAQSQNKASVTPLRDAKPATASSSAITHDSENNKFAVVENNRFVVPRSRNHRPTVNSGTFVPPNTLPKIKEGSPGVFNPVYLNIPASLTSVASLVQASPKLLSSANDRIYHQIERHLAGQYDWLLSYPAIVDARATAKPVDCLASTAMNNHKALLYGCNLVQCAKKPLNSQARGSNDQLANTFTFIATPLSASIMDVSQSSIGSTLPIAISQLPPSYEECTLHVPDSANGTAAFGSPSLSTSFQSQRSGSLAEALSPSASFTGSRIEDSLEKLDKLEDELEAIDAVTSLDKLSVADSPAKPSQTRPSATGRAPKRASMMNLRSAAPTVTPNTRNASLKHSTSLHLRQAIESSPARKPIDKLASSCVNKRNSMLARPPSSKSAKPPTVPNFELPGEAVARRLKEQREARRLQQEEAGKMAASPSKPRTLTKPCFELPGEAISRRKREEREARIKAQAEEERRRREFKARPLRQSIGPNSLPRETATSSARAAHVQQDATRRRESDASMRQKRASIGSGFSVPPRLTNSSLRTSISSVTVGTTFKDSDADTVSVTSSAGDVSARKQIRRKSTFFETVHETRVRERQEKELAMKSAREEAAERSRIASREWAEKQKRRSMLVRDVTPTTERR